MGVKAKWGPKSFLTSPQKIVPFTGFSSSVKLKSDSENDTSGTEPTNTRGRELQPVSFSTTYHVAAGSDPIAEFNSWVGLIGKYHPLYVGSQRWGPAERFLLQSVDVSDMLQAESGTVLSLTLSLSFTEYSEGKTSKLADASGGTQGNPKKEAMNATASAAERENKKRLEAVENTSPFKDSSLRRIFAQQQLGKMGGPMEW